MTPSCYSTSKQSQNEIAKAIPYKPSVCCWILLPPSPLLLLARTILISFSRFLM